MRPCNGGGHERASNTFACVLCDVCVCVLMFDDADERERERALFQKSRGPRAYSYVRYSLLMRHGGVDNAYHALRLSAPTSGASTDHQALR